MLAVAWLALIVVAALAAPLLPLRDFDETDYGDTLRGPSLTVDEPLGTDQLGRSVLSRVVHGARSSLLVGIGATALGVVVGGAIGMAVAFRGGRVDAAATVVVDAVLAFPPLVLLLGASTILGRSIGVLALALALLAIPTFTRLARATTLSLRTREFVLAAHAAGARPRRILVREILPNVVPPVAAYALIVAAVLIVAEGSLGFVGLGVERPNPSWGGMIAQGRDELEDHPHIVVAPAVALYLTVLALHALGDQLRRGSGREADLSAR